MTLKFWQLAILIFVSLLIISASFFLTHSALFYVADFFWAYYLIFFILVYLIFYSTLSIFLVRVLLKIKPLREMNIKFNDKKIFYWKFILIINEMGILHWIKYFPVFFRPFLYHLAGAKIGKGVITSGDIVEPYFANIGDGSIIGRNALIVTHVINGDHVELNKVFIGKKVTVGVGAVIMPGVKIGDGSIITPNSVVASNSKVPKREVWGGAPAKFICKVNDL